MFMGNEQIESFFWMSSLLSWFFFFFWIASLLFLDFLFHLRTNLKEKACFSFLIISRFGLVLCDPMYLGFE